MTASIRQTKTEPSHKPRILIVGPYPPAVGGMVSVIQSILNSRLKDAYELAAFPMTSARSDAESLLRRIARHLSRWTAFVHVLRSRRIDVVYLHTCSGATFYRQMLDFAAARMLGAKTIWHLHGGRFDKFLDELRGLRRLAVRHALERADRVIVLGKNWQRVIEDFAPAAQTVVVQNAVDVSPQAHDLPPDDRRCIFVGDLSPQKGVDDLLEAAARDLQDAELRIIGAGSQNRHHELDARITAFGARGRIKLLGAIPQHQVQAELRQAALFVLPSYGEGLPVAMLEAMAAGVPVVVSNVGAIPEVVRDGREGFLIQPGDRSALVDRCRRLLRDQSLRRDMGRHARKRICRQFGLDRMGQKLSDVMADLLGGREGLTQ